jgi:hypothetical protein
MESTAEHRGLQLAPPGPLGLVVRSILGVISVYFFVALPTKWNVFLELDPIESDRFYTLVTLWLLSEVFTITFRRPWGVWPTVVFVVGGAAIGGAGLLMAGEVWTPVLAGWVYAGDLLVMAALAVSFPVAIVTRSPGCELDALTRLIVGPRDEAVKRRGCAVGLDRLDRWETARKR